jgi:hypothetical protein
MNGLPNTWKELQIAHTGCPILPTYITKYTVATAAALEFCRLKKHVMQSCWTWYEICTSVRSAKFSSHAALLDLLGQLYLSRKLRGNQRGANKKNWVQENRNNCCARNNKRSKARGSHKQCNTVFSVFILLVWNKLQGRRNCKQEMKGRQTKEDDELHNRENP